jgi:hypothetical protein
MRQGRWTSRAMVDRYVHHGTLWQECAAAYMGLEQPAPLRFVARSGVSLSLPCPWEAALQAPGRGASRKHAMVELKSVTIRRSS